MSETFKKCVDIGDLVNKITSEMSKLAELFRNLGSSADPKDIEKQQARAETISGVIDTYINVLRERFSAFEHGDRIAAVIIEVMNIAMSNAISAKYENLKRVEQIKEQKDIISIANWDNISRGAKETKAIAIQALNTYLSELYGEVYKFIPRVRTF